MALWIRITPCSTEPIYIQIVAQIHRVIAKKEVVPGDKLPPVRTLASQLLVNPNTVARAYSILEQQGLVSTKPGSGTFVADPKLLEKNQHSIDSLAEKMDDTIAQSLNLGLNPPQPREMFDDRLDGFSPTQKKGMKNNE